MQFWLNESPPCLEKYYYRIKYKKAKISTKKKKVIIKEKILNFGDFFCVGWKKE